MKRYKKLICFSLTLGLSLGISLTPSATPKKEDLSSAVPHAVHISTGTWNDQAIKVNFSDINYIENVTSSDKALTASATSFITGTSTDSTNNYGFIGIYAPTAGTYTVTFDLCDKDGQQLSSHSTEVYVNDDTPFRDVTFDGIDLSEITDEFLQVSSGKLSIEMNDGYELVSITCTTYDKNGLPTIRELQNNNTLKLGKYAARSKSTTVTSYDYGSSLSAITEIEIAYVDKYTKTTETAIFTLKRLAK